jgi:hypothetical protein
MARSNECSWFELFLHRMAKDEQRALDHLSCSGCRTRAQACRTCKPQYKALKDKLVRKNKVRVS